MSAAGEFRYDPAGGPMKIVFFFSGGASSMDAVLKSPDYNRHYVVEGAFTNMPEEVSRKGREIAKEHNIEVLYFDTSSFSKRSSFYRLLMKSIPTFQPDVIGLSGFLGRYSVIGDPLLSAYKNRIINVHPANLGIVINSGAGHPLDAGREKVMQERENLGDRDYGNAVSIVKSGGWKRLYTGDDAVAMAVLFGEDEVCSTIHSVTEELDGGPILVQSKRMPVDVGFVGKMLKRNAFDRIAGYAHELQARMKTECDGPAFCKALEFLAEGRMGIDDDHVTLDGKPLPYGGYQMDM